MTHGHMLHIVVGLKMAAIAAVVTDLEGMSRDIEAETEIAVAGRNTDSLTSRALRLIVQPYRCVTGKVLFENIVLGREVPSAGREEDVLSRMTGTGLHIETAFALRQTFKVGGG